MLPNAGKVSKQTADDYATTEYEKFEVRRREYKESLAEMEYLKQLEAAAKQLTSENKEDDKHRQ